MGYRYNVITGELDYYDSSAEVGNDITQIDADTGSALPSSGIVNLISANNISTTASGNTVTISNLADISKYIVDQTVGATSYQTIQSALDAANAAGGNATVYVRHGTYTEDLTLYDTVFIEGQTESGTIISGSHTPPNSGIVNIRKITFEDASSIFDSAAAGSTTLLIEDCTFSVTNGYSFNLPNWTGSIAIFDIGNGGVNDGFLNNTAGCSFFAFATGFGNGSANIMNISGTFEITTADCICPINFQSTASGEILNCSFDFNITTSDDASVSIYNSSFNTGAVQSITHNSSNPLILSTVSINSTNNPAVGGSGSIDITGIDFVNNSVFGGALSLSGGKSVAATGRLLNRSANAVAVYAGGGEISEVGPLTDGQLVIGGTGLPPSAANLASAGGTVAITNGAGSINLEAGATTPTSFVTDAGTATPALNILNVLGGSNISTAGAGNTLTVNVSGTTDHAIQVGNATGSLTSVGPGSTGELLVSTTGGDPSWSNTSYGDFSFNNITGIGVPRTVSIANTDVNVASTADLRLSTPPLGGDSMVSWEVQGSLFYAAGVDNSVAGDPWKLTTSSHPSAGTAAITVDNATAAVTLSEAYEFPIADGAANEVLKTDGAGNLDFATIDSLTTDNQNVYYVGKHGNDANDGLTINKAVLTFGQALILAAAAIPSAANRFAIVCFDDGIYSENITCIQYVDIFAPNADLTGNIMGADDCHVKFRAQNVATGQTGINKTVGLGYFFCDIDNITLAGNAIGLLTSSGFSNLIFKRMYVVNGVGIGDLSTAISHIHIKGGDIYVAGTGLAIGRSNAGSIVGRVDHLLDTGGGSGTAITCLAGIIDLQISRIDSFATGITATNGVINIQVNELSATAAYNVGAAGELNLIVNEMTGTETNAGTLSLIRGDGTSRMNDIISTSVTDTSRTQHAVSIYGASGVLSEVGPLTDGQLVVGSTGLAPVAVTITAGTGTSITNGAGAITVNSTGGGLTWNVETGVSATMSVNNGYIGNNAAGVTFTLPATAAVGSIIRVTGLQASWTIAQNAGQTIYYGTSATTTGIGGSLTSTDDKDAVELVCTVADTNFQVLSSIGNITLI